MCDLRRIKRLSMKNHFVKVDTTCNRSTTISLRVGLKKKRTINCKIKIIRSRLSMLWTMKERSARYVDVLRRKPAHARPTLGTVTVAVDGGGDGVVNGAFYTYGR